jgi:hypothetical protein
MTAAEDDEVVAPAQEALRPQGVPFSRSDAFEIIVGLAFY